METIFFRQPRLVALTVLVLVAAGASALLSIGRQEDPTITNLFATVTTVYPGAEPARVEALITEKLETRLQEIAAIELVESTSSSGISIVNIELLDTLDDDEIEVAWVDVREAMEKAELSFPAGAGKPDFSTDGAGTYSGIVALIPDAATSTATAQRYAQVLADRIQRVTGTKAVTLFGQVEEEVLVEIDPFVLASLNLSVDQLASIIRQADAKVQAGNMRSEDSNFIIEVHGEIDAIERIKAIPVVASGGLVTRLQDVASIGKNVVKPQSEMAYSSGKEAVLVAFRLSDDLQIDVWMSDVRKVLQDFDRELPISISSELVFDQSAYTRDRLSRVATNMAIGIGLVILVLLVTLGARAALIVAMVLPLVTLASLATMNAMGLAIHQMSLTGLIVALGLLVDAAIVMTDEIRQRLREGQTRLLAVQKSVRRLFAPLLASTLTTALSFMPMVLLPGPAGDFVGSIAIAVIIMLTWSYLIAITVTAAVAGWILPDTAAAGGWLSNGVTGNFISRLFRRSVSWSLRNPASSVVLALVLPVLGFASAGTLTAQFFPGVDRNQFHIELELGAGTSIEKTRLLALEVDELLTESDGVEQVTWVIGKSAPAFYYNLVADKDRAPQFAQALITTSSPAATARLVPQLQSSLNGRFAEARVLVRDLVQGPPVTAPVEIRLLGPQLEVLSEYGERLRVMLTEVGEIHTIRTSLDAGAPKLLVDVNEDSARLAGLSLAQIARQLEASLEGSVGGSLLDGVQELPVRVRVGDMDRQNLSLIANFPIHASVPGASDNAFAYQSVPLSSLAEISLQPAQSPISRRDGERTNTVQAFIQYGLLPEEALKQVEAVMQAENFTMPDGYRIQTGGDSDARDNTLNNLLASLGIIVTLSIASIVLTFNSFRLAAVTLVVAVLCAGLSMLSLVVFQFPFGINAIIGVIGSIGVSINAAIIILTGLQNNPAARSGNINAMVDVVMSSGRHILSTTVTTFGGFLPLILEGGGFWPPFAMSVAGGVLLSSIVSFYFSPPMFRLIYAGRNKPLAQGRGHDHVHGTNRTTSDDVSSGLIQGNA